MTRARAGDQPEGRVLRDPPTRATRTDELVKLDLSTIPGRLNLSEFFGDDHPVELEIGVGKGRFILLAGAARPEVNYLGVEVARRFYDRAVERVGKRGLTNVRLVHAEASSFIADRLGDNQLAGAHVYVPDPWPKKRHHKRRFFQPATVADLARVLRPGALLRVVTDHPEYADVIVAVLGGRPEFVDAGPDATVWELPGMGDYTTLGVTNFEIKYRRLGWPIRRFAWRRR